MGKVKTLKGLKGKENNSHPLTKMPSSGQLEGVLTPVTLYGVVVPWSKSLGDGRNSDYKLTCPSGIEYFLVADSEWRAVLSLYCWDEVKVVGLLNVNNMTVIPRRVYPKGPTGEREKVVDLASWKGRDLAKKVTKVVTELVFVPAVMLALLS